MEKSPRQRFWFTIRLLVSIFLVAWLIWQYDWYMVWEAMRRASLGGIGALLVGIMINRLVAFYRFWILLRSEGVKLSSGAVLRLGFLSSFVTNFLPTTVGGDVVKVGWLVSRGYSGWRAAFWTLFDRLSNMTAVGLMLPFCLSLPLFQRQLVERFHIKTDATTQFLIFAVLCLLSGFILGLWKAKPTHSPGQEAAEEKGLFQRAAAVWHKLLSRKGIFGLLAAISIVSILPNLLGTWWMAGDIGVKINLVEVTAVYVVIYFVTLLPISLNGLGVQEVTTAYLYQSLGATQAQAAALAVLLRFIIWLTSLPGAIWLSRGVMTSPSQTPREQVEENV